MKIFGYIDDLMAAVWNWQVNLPLYFSIPLFLIEIMIVCGIIDRIVRRY
jgi:hypothetical protein